MPGPQGAARADIIALLRDGYSNNQIGRLLHTSPKRAARIRAELELPAAWRKQTITVEQKWATYTKPVDGGHLDWTGYRRSDTTPMFMLCGRNYSARRIAFRIANRREPVGRVKAGCGWPPCVAPEHAEDQTMRHQYQTIFGGAA